MTPKCVMDIILIYPESPGTLKGRATYRVVLKGIMEMSRVSTAEEVIEMPGVLRPRAIIYIYKVRIDDMSNIREHHSISCIWTNLRLTVRIPGLRIQPLDQEKSRSVLVNHFAERSNSDALKKTLTITHDILYTLRVLACLVGLYSYLILTKTHENSRFSSYLTGLSLLSVSHGSLLVYLMVPTHENSRKLTIFFVPYGS